MALLFIISVGLFIISLVYMFATERSNLVVNIIMYVIGMIIPSIIVSLCLLTDNYAVVAGYFLQLLAYVPWWGYLIAIVVWLFCSFYLMFVTGEKLEKTYDYFGNQTGWKGGQIGLTFLTLALSFFLIFSLICAIAGV